MKPQPDAMMIIQSRLSEAVGRLRADAPRLGDAAIARRLDAIGRTAREHGMTPLCEVTRRSMGACGLPGYRTAIARHLERMDDAIGCRALDEAGTAAIMASIAVRLA